MKARYRYIFGALALVAFTLMLDILSKTLIHDRIGIDAPPVVIIPGLISFTHMHNTGAAFSFGADSKTALTIFITLTFVCIAAIAYVVWRWGTRSKFMTFSLALIFSGALGNLLDRLRFGYVDDFIKFEFWPQFAIFNVADICVCVGAVCFVIYFLFMDGKKDKEKKDEKSGESDDKNDENA